MRESSLESLLLLATLFVIHEKHARALTLLEGLYDLAPRDERILRLLAHALLAEKHHERALEILRELTGVAGEHMTHSDTACVLRLKAAALWNLGRRDEARAVLDASIAPPEAPANKKKAARR